MHAQEEGAEIISSKDGTRQFVQSMFYPHTDTPIRAWVIADMSAAPPEIGLSAIEELMSRNITGQAARVFPMFI